MADVVTASTSAGGLGTKPARWAFVFMWATGVWLGLMGQITPLELFNASAYAAAPIGGLLLTTPGNQPLPRHKVFWLPVIALYVTVVVLYRTPEVSTVWALTFTAYLVAFLIPRGNPVAGGVGSALVIGYALAWGLVRDPSGSGLALLLGIPVGCLVAGVVWRLVLGWIVHKERAHRGAAANAAEHAAASDEAVAASRRELADIRAAVTPLLSRIVAGETIDDAMRTELTLTEASIRDRIRAPHLQHPLLLDAIARLRARGVIVVVLGEPAASGAVIATSLATRIVELISGTCEGRVTVRNLPEGRAAAASVVVQTRDTSEQVLLAADGQVRART
ncbi:MULTISPECIES: hypothetical protein [unclassified Microbacterium]|uniref:hypothetical protein n=1 Tax=unclassified Microbacterium TaxID=2609290 RepID=UPI0030199A92